jgi:hypothetical protein
LTLAATRDRGAFGDAYGQSLTLALRIPFGSADRQRARLATAGAEQAEAESQLELERSRVETDIAAAQLRADAARRVVEAADQRAALAVETKRFFEKSFRLGETDLPTRLRVELEAFEAERQRERSRIDLAQAVSQWRQGPAARMSRPLQHISHRIPASDTVPSPGDHADDRRPVRRAERARRRWPRPWRSTHHFEPGLPRLRPRPSCSNSSASSTARSSRCTSTTAPTTAR